MIHIIFIMIILIQYYIAWMTYKNWFNDNITYCKIEESYSFKGMLFLLPFFIWIPIIGVFLICYAMGTTKYLTIKWKL